MVCHRAFYSLPADARAGQAGVRVPEGDAPRAAPPERAGLASWQRALRDPSWQGALAGASAHARAELRVYVLTPAAPPPVLLPPRGTAAAPPASAAAAAPLAPMRLLSATQARRHAGGAAATEEDHSDSDSEEWGATAGTQAVAAGRTGGPAQVGLFVGGGAPGDAQGGSAGEPPAACAAAAARPLRPPSPKYDESCNFLEALQFHGCEALPSGAAAPPGATPAAATSPAQPPRAAAAPSAPPAHASGAAAAAAAAQRGKARRLADASQITPPSDTHASTPASQAGFAAGAGAPAHVSLMVIEVYAATRGACFVGICVRLRSCADARDDAPCRMRQVICCQTRSMTRCSAYRCASRTMARRTAR